MNTKVHECPVPLDRKLLRVQSTTSVRERLERQVAAIREAPDEACLFS
jgi:hypothetical protein